MKYEVIRWDSDWWGAKFEGDDDDFIKVSVERIKENATARINIKVNSEKTKKIKEMDIEHLFGMCVRCGVVSRALRAICDEMLRELSVKVLYTKFDVCNFGNTNANMLEVNLENSLLRHFLIGAGFKEYKNPVEFCYSYSR